MITGFEVVETYSRSNRLYVRLENKDGKRQSIPKANYVWLKHNPIFEFIPKGYVIHHLDHDQLNDDPSNLVIMQKHHHSAHHWKQKIITPKIRLNDDKEFDPCQEPTITHDKIQDRYILYFREILSNGEKIRKRLATYKGVSLKTKEVAEEAKNLLWDAKQKTRAERILLDEQFTYKHQALAS